MRSSCCAFDCLARSEEREPEGEECKEALWNRPGPEVQATSPSESTCSGKKTVPAPKRGICQWMRGPCATRWRRLKQANTGQRAHADGARDRDALVQVSLQEWGRYKYCGLRPDPFGGPSPQYRAWTSRDIPLPHLPAEELEAVLQLSERLVDLAKAGYRTDHCTVLRFLREQEGNVDKAEAFFRESVEWWIQHDVYRALTHWDLELYERLLAPWWPSGGFLGIGREGEPVVLERIGQCDWRAIHDNVPWEMLLKMEIVHCLRTIAACEEDAARRGIPFEGATLIEDFAGLNFQTNFRLTTLSRLGELLGSRLLLVPRTGKRIIVINAPSVFAAFWNLSKHLLLKPYNISLVQFVSPAKTLEVLRKYCDDSIIPAYLGGSKTVDGDPQCRRLIAPGGTPPQAVLEMLQKQAHC